FYLFSSVGAKIVSIFSIIVGFIFLTEFSVGDFFSDTYQKIRAFFIRLKTRYQEKRALQAEMKEAMEPEEMEESTHFPADSDEEPVIQDFTDVAYSNDVVKKENTSGKVDAREKGTNVDAEGDAEVDVSPLTVSENH